MSTQPIEPTPTPTPPADPAPPATAPAPATDPQPPADPPADPANPADPKPTETVEYWKQRSRTNEAQAKANADAARKLKEIEDRDLSDLDKAKRDAAEATERATKAERDALVRQVALDKGLPASLAARLQGTTEDELAADADELLKLVKAPASPRPDPSQGPRPPASPQDAADAEYEQYFPPRPTKPTT